MPIRAFTAALAVSFAAAPMGQADEVTDALQSAVEAYEEGDLAYAIEELDYAKQLIAAQNADALVQFLPEAPDGWTREVNTEMNAGLAMMGGGTGAEATYDSEAGSMTLTIMADNPMVAGMAGMIANAGLMGGKVERVGREKFMVMDGEINGMIDNRILVKASGDDVDTMLALIETMDFRALGNFGR